jgi:hypothetical protein
MTNIENENIRQLSAKIESQKETIDRIEEALLGNKFNKDGGLIQRIDMIETKQDDVDKLLSKYQYKWAGIVWVVMFLSGLLAIGYYIAQIIKDIVK